ncbi:uncharacterized protein [Drosophila tropicalis]
MILNLVLFYVMVIALLLMYMAPTTEGCFIFLACLLDPSLCGFNTTST